MLKRKITPRRWGDANKKIRSEGRCRVCKQAVGLANLEAAHVIGRAHDALATGPRGGKYVYVHPDSIVPLCGGFSENFCHGRYDRRALDLLPYLTPDEQERAVQEAGGIISALKRVSPMGGSW